jgi:hypothetical protein
VTGAAVRQEGSMSGSASNSSSETHDSSTPRVQITESPRDSIIFTLARFVGTLVALASITILVSG